MPIVAAVDSLVFCVAILYTLFLLGMLCGALLMAALAVASEFIRLMSAFKTRIEENDE
jgi:hypothetical protein